MRLKELHYGVTHQVELPDGTDMWVKLEATGELAQLEEPEQASKQLAAYVHELLAKRVLEAVEHAQSIGST